jgi:hypothetical protein
VASPATENNAPLVPVQEPGASSFGQCGNCDATLAGPFCSQCGEKKLSADDYSIRHLAEEALGEFAHFDTKFLRTLKVLLTKPGEISRAHFHGGRSRYTKPLTLFVIINVIFFLFQPHTGLLRFGYASYMGNAHYKSMVQSHLLETREPEQTYSVRFDANLQDQKKSLLIVSVPVLALVMGLFFVGARRTYAEHLIFSVQVYAFLLIYLPLAVLLLAPVFWALGAVGPTAAPLLSALRAEVAIVTITVAGLTIYIYHGLQRAYGMSRFRAGIAAFALSWTVMLLTGLYHNVLFFATFWIT